MPPDPPPNHPPGPSPGLAVEAVFGLPAVVWESDADDYRMLFVSPGARELLGHDPDRWVGEPAFWEAHIHPDDREAAIAAADRTVQERGTSRIEYRFRHADGSYRRFIDSMQVVTDANGRTRLVGVMVDITRESEAAAAPSPPAPARPHDVPAEATASTPLHEAIVDNLGDGVYYVDLDRRISYWNRGAERLTGYRASEVVGRLCHDNLLCHVDANGTNLCQSRCPLAATLQDGLPQEAIVWFRHADGSRRPAHVRTAPIVGAGGTRIVGGVEIFSDATGLIEAQDAAEAARRDALTDALTGLPNRRLLDAVLASRQDDLDNHARPFGFLMIDVDRFKTVNDAHGHDVGDEALRLVAATLRGALRAGDSLARWGGEEFVVVAGAVDEAGLASLAERILGLVRATHLPLRDGGRLPVRVSVGGALAVPHETLPDLFARADRALFAAKQAGRDRFVLDAATEWDGLRAPSPGARSR